MSSTKSVDYVRCMKCSKILKCSRYDVSALLDHIRSDHPEIDIIDTDTKRKRHFHSAPTNNTAYQIEDCPCRDEECHSSAKSSSKSKLAKDIDLAHYSATSEILAKYPEIKECEYAPHNPSAQVAYTRRYKLSTPTQSVVSESVLQQPFQHTLYRTSIEKWRPADGNIYCPQCGSNKRPLIKTKAERFTRNDCGACCLLSCWPFCFIPWILPGQNQEYLYCANCKTFLGLYDRPRNCLKPNRLFTTNSHSDPKPPAEVAQIKSNQQDKNKLLENESPPAQSLLTNSPKSTRVSSIIINGKELPPETVARIEKYKHLGAFMGIDLKALTDTPHSTQRHEANKENETAAPSAAKKNHIE